MRHIDHYAFRRRRSEDFSRFGVKSFRVIMALPHSRRDGYRADAGGTALAEILKCQPPREIHSHRDSVRNRERSRFTGQYFIGVDDGDTCARAPEAHTVPR
ncbi:hypothetical protein EVAR_26835_1 [Eumeta japonica]|uniref:Uncharacterized protein n=1 Tax=Eumeta variegata TaxID=151549 RepID=A0A4C1VX38_EUMVA|nr:hypothetical protein EVAR_26835_1 [Eumeta japonica]